MLICYKTQGNKIGYAASIDLLPEGAVSISYQELQDIKNPPSLELVKLEKIKEIEAARDKACIQNVQALSTIWQADKRSQELIGQAITLTQAGLPLPPVWRDFYNQDIPINSISELLAIAAAMAVQTQNAYSKSWDKKALINSSVTIQEVRNIIW
jgi:hypothetical protein